MSNISRFIATYRARLPVLALESWLTWPIRTLPGALGFGCRYLVLKLVAKRLKGVCFIYPNVWISHSYGLEVGSGFSINTGAQIDARGCLVIGNNVMVGPNVVISTSDHDFSDSGGPMNSKDHVLKPVQIGSNVWIAANAVITGGVRISDGAVIASGAVVTSDIPANAIAAGIPAKVISYRGKVSNFQ
jgi:acetyltransferase-like isoleucine patch superfamily enzyme